jgi:hypothetical protein
MVVDDNDEKRLGKRDEKSSVKETGLGEKDSVSTGHINKAN